MEASAVKWLDAFVDHPVLSDFTSVPPLVVLAALEWTHHANIFIPTTPNDDSYTDQLLALLAAPGFYDNQRGAATLALEKTGELLFEDVSIELTNAVLPVPNLLETIKSDPFLLTIWSGGSAAAAFKADWESALRYAQSLWEQIARRSAVAEGRLSAIMISNPLVNLQLLPALQLVSSWKFGTRFPAVLDMLLRGGANFHSAELLAKTAAALVLQWKTAYEEVPDALKQRHITSNHLYVPSATIKGTIKAYVDEEQIILSEITIDEYLHWFEAMHKAATRLAYMTRVLELAGFALGDWISLIHVTLQSRLDGQFVTNLVTNAYTVVASEEMLFPDYLLLQCDVMPALSLAHWVSHERYRANVDKANARTDLALMPMAPNNYARIGAILHDLCANMLLESTPEDKGFAWWWGSLVTRVAGGDYATFYAVESELASFFVNVTKTPLGGDLPTVDKLAEQWETIAHTAPDDVLLPRWPETVATNLKRFVDAFIETEDAVVEHNSSVALARLVWLHQTNTTPPLLPSSPKRPLSPPLPGWDDDDDDIRPQPKRQRTDERPPLIIRFGPVARTIVAQRERIVLDLVSSSSSEEEEEEEDSLWQRFLVRMQSPDFLGGTENGARDLMEAILSKEDVANVLARVLKVRQQQALAFVRDETRFTNMLAEVNTEVKTRYAFWICLQAPTDYAMTWPLRGNKKDFKLWQLSDENSVTGLALEVGKYDVELPLEHYVTALPQVVARYYWLLSVVPTDEELKRGQLRRLIRSFSNCIEKMMAPNNPSMAYLRRHIQTLTADERTTLYNTALMWLDTMDAMVTPALLKENKPHFKTYHWTRDVRKIVTEMFVLTN